MRVSLNQIKQLVTVDLPPVEDLVERINRQLGSVEEIIDLTDKYRAPLVVKVVECAKHPDADRLSVTKIDDSGQIEHVDRDDDGLIQVVCGAPNVTAGMLAIWLPPGSTVPATYSDEDPFVLTPKELRGVISNGMLAAADELDLGEDHSGIISIEAKDLNQPIDNLDSLVGANFAQTFGLDDTVIDIENKMFTHRPDLFGQMGVAREISAILQPLPAGDQMTEPSYRNQQWYWQVPQFANCFGLEFEAFNDATDSVRRFMAVAINNITVGQSPLWLKAALVVMGSKPVNSVVDATNYIMLLTGQPTHAYDYDKLRGHKLGARFAKSGEKIDLLNGKTYKLDQTDIVIADDEGPVGLGGVMGGLDSQVSDDTTAIVLEVANFDMYQSRKTSMRHGLFTDAVTRFSKGQSPIQADRVIGKLLDMIGGQPASQVFDLGSKDWVGVENVHDGLEVSAEFVSARLGHQFSPYLISNMLRLVNFASWKIDDDSTSLSIHAPFWRTDIESPEDIVEEIGRLYDFGRLPRQLPKRSISPAEHNLTFDLKAKLRSTLARAGANEVLTYSFVNENILTKSGQDLNDAYQIVNSLSPDLQYYRLSVLPSLLDKVHMNIKAGYHEFALFEIGKSHSLSAGLNDESVPVETNRLALVYTARRQKDGAAYFRAKRLLEYTLSSIGVAIECRPRAAATGESAPSQPFEASRSADVVDSDSGKVLGQIGEFRPRVTDKFKLPEYSAGLEIDLEVLQTVWQVTKTSYQPLSRLPSVERDVCFEVNNDLEYAGLLQTVEAELAKLDIPTSVSPIDIYQLDDSDRRRTTFRIVLQPSHATLTGEAASRMIDNVSTAVAKTHHATII